MNSRCTWPTPSIRNPSSVLGAWALAYQDVISNWWFVILFAVIMMGVPQISRAIKPEAFLTREQVRARRAEVPLELVGIERPFTEHDRRMLDAALDLDGDGDQRVSIAERPFAFAIASDQATIDDIAGEATDREPSA